jgi:hypothetical protein
LVQTLLSLQTTGVPGWQEPPAQASLVVQALLSSQGAALLLYTHPVVGSHPSSVQILLSLQTTGVSGWQEPPAQASPVVQALLSLQGAVLLVYWQPIPAVQTSSVQMLVSLQRVLLGVPLHEKPEQVSFWVQAIWSLQVSPLQSESVQSVSPSPSLSRPSLQFVSASSVVYETLIIYQYWLLNEPPVGYEDGNAVAGSELIVFVCRPTFGLKSPTTSAAPGGAAASVSLA